MNTRHGPALRDFSAGMGETWRETTLGRNDWVYQRPTLEPGSREEHWALTGGEEGRESY